MELAHHRTADLPPHQSDYIYVHTCHEEGHIPPGVYGASIDVFWVKYYLGLHTGKGCVEGLCDLGAYECAPLSSIIYCGRAVLVGGALLSYVSHKSCDDHHRTRIGVTYVIVYNGLALDSIMLGCEE